MISRLMRLNPHLRQTAKNIRMWWLRKRYGLRHVDKTFYIGRPGPISRDLIAGAYSFIGPGAQICPNVQIGAYTMLGPDVMIVGGDHLFDKPGTPIIFSGRPEMPQTIVGADCWLGARSTIIAGVSIGDGAIVAAGAVVTRDVEANTIVAGVPARAIRKRFDLPDDIDAHRAMLARPPEMGEYCKLQTEGKP